MLSFQYGVSLCLIYTLCLTTVLAQDPCAGPSNINVEFPELDPPNPIPTGDSRYAQVLLTGSEPFSVTIEADPTARSVFPIDEYFSHSYNSFGANPGYTLYMTKAIDRDGPTDYPDDDTNILQYMLICRSTSTSDPLFKTLKVQLVDENDNSPNFKRAPYSVSVNELTPIGLTIFRQILATDLDEGPNKQIWFSLSNTPGSQFNGTDYFSLPSPAEGFVAVANVLDFETMYRLTNGTVSEIYYDITVTATDEGTPPQSNTTTLRITILDGNDQGPEFIYPSCLPGREPLTDIACAFPRYRSSLISGSTKPATLVFTPDPVDPSDPDGHVDIIMQDRDTLNSPIMFRVVYTSPAGYEIYFSTTSSRVSVSNKQYKGVITFTGDLAIDHATVPQLELIIQAEEDTPNRRSVYGSVIVDIVEESTPTLSITASSSVAEVLENAPVLTRISEEKSTALLKLTLSDSFTPPDGYPPYFDLRVSTGVPFQISHENYTGYVEIIRSLDYEMEQQYNFTVTIISLGPEKEFASIPLTVNVLDVNDNPPIFPSQMSLPNNVINEVPQGDHSTHPHYITSVWASDLDFGPVTYSLDHVDPPVSNGTFRVDPSGVVSLASSVTVGDFYSVYVKASDSGLPSLSSTTIVYVRVTA